MIIEKFLGWIECADTNARVLATTALARAYLTSPLEVEERCAAEAALTYLLDDPSPKVRHAMAEVLSTSPVAPGHIVNALAADQLEIAALIILRSPVLTDIDLIDRVALGDDGTQQLIAMRPQVSKTLAAAIAEVGCLDACRELVDNTGADIARVSLRRICERHGYDGEFRQRMLDDARLPADCRVSLVKQHGQALSELTIVRSLIGQSRAERVTQDACMRSCLAVVDDAEPAEYDALVEHLRLSGDLTTGFVIRTLAYGKIQFLSAILCALAEEAPIRVESMLASGREASMKALLVKSGFSDVVTKVLIHGLNTWRAVANGRLVAGPQEVSRLMMIELERSYSGRGHANDDLIALLRAVYFEVLHQNSKNHALAIAAA